MQAIVFDGRQARLRSDQPEPKPAAGEARVTVTLAGLCRTDLEILKGYQSFTGVMGHEFVGVVASAGRAELVGKRVVCEINCVCGKCDMCASGLRNHCRARRVIGISGRDGCFAEQIVVPELNLHPVPDDVTDEEAVFVEPLAAALQVIHQVSIEPRMQVAVLGDGRLALLAAMVLQRIGCKLLVVGKHPEKMTQFERRHIVCKPQSEIRLAADQDVIVECTGRPEGLALALRMVRPRGRIVLKSTYARGEPLDLSPMVVNEVTVIGSRCGGFPEAISLLARREVEVGSMIWRTFRLGQFEKAVAEAAKPRAMKVLLKPGS
jgi:threonine dehydrogenase-like Zn-dependent dehydrogenase